ncbi:putative ribonuclease H-like domain-containing protein [Tanacetum coccineum]
MKKTKYNEFDEEVESSKLVSYILYYPRQPTSIAKALEDPDWVAAMQDEMQQFINQKVWKLVPLPDGKHAIGTKWILKNKREPLALGFCTDYKLQK